MTETVIKLVIQAGSLGVLALLLWLLSQLACKELPEWRALLTNHLTENAQAMTNAANKICEAVGDCARFRNDLLSCLQRIERNGGVKSE